MRWPSSWRRRAAAALLPWVRRSAAESRATSICWISWSKSAPDSGRRAASLAARLVARMCAGRWVARISSPRTVMTRRWMRFSSSRTLPGQGCCSKAERAVSSMCLMGMPLAMQWVLEEVLGEERDVAGALAKGWELDGDDVDAVVEVFAEAAGAGHLFEVFVGGADEAEVDFAEGAAAEALHHVVFEDAEELGLKGEGEGCDLVEEEGAGVGEFDLAGAGFGGAGEGSAFAAEEFGLDEVLGEGGAVEADVGLVGARAEGDEGAGDELFAGAAFAADEDVDVAAGDLLDGVVDGAHGLADADEVLEAAVLEGLLAHVLASGFFGAGAEEIGEGETEFGDVDGAAEVGVGAGFEGLLFDGAGAGAAEGDENEVGVELAEFVEDGKAAVGGVVVGVDVEDDGFDVGFAGPAGEVVVVCRGGRPGTRASVRGRGLRRIPCPR